MSSLISSSSSDKDLAFPFPFLSQIGNSDEDCLLIGDNFGNCRRFLEYFIGNGRDVLAGLGACISICFFGGMRTILSTRPKELTNSIVSGGGILASFNLASQLFTHSIRILPNAPCEDAISSTSTTTSSGYP